MNDEWFQRCFMDIINPFDSEGHNENADDVLFERSDFLENQLKFMNKKQKVFTEEIIQLLRDDSKIKEIDDKISNIRVEKKEVNNYYTQKKEEIKNADKKQIDSLLRKRYNF